MKRDKRASTVSRLTWDLRAPAPYESAWSVLLKVAALNLLTEKELASLISSSESVYAEVSTLWRSADPIRLASLARHLGVTEHRLRQGYIETSGFDEAVSEDYKVRHCPECFKLGYHCVFFELPFIAACPWHCVPLAPGCRLCVRAMKKLEHHGSRGSMRWACPACGVYFDFYHAPKVNRVDSETEVKIRASAVELERWWRKYCCRSGEARCFARPLFREKKEEVAIDKQWRMGFIASLCAQPVLWTFTDIPEPTRVIFPVRVQPWSAPEPTISSLPYANHNALKSIRRSIFSNHLRCHRTCLSELSKLGAFERSALDALNVCTASVAYLSWSIAYGFSNSRSPAPRSLDWRSTRQGTYMADDSCSALIFAYADFFRIWSSLEVILQSRAVRMQILSDLVNLCNLPFNKLNDSNNMIGILLPDADYLQARALARCQQRLKAGLPMYNSGAAFANSGWNAVPDWRIPFTMRSFRSGVRNTYWHLEV
jgi:hypothetical protein